MAASERSARPPLGRRFLAVWTGQTVSEIGSMLSGVGVAIHVFVETGSPAWLGVLSALVGLPFLLVSPFATLIDRFPRRRVMILADMVAAVGPVFALAMAASGRLEVWHLVVGGFIGSIGTAIQVPASQAAVPALALPGAVDRANALKQLGPAIGLVAGPALAAPMVATWGVESILLLDVVTFLVGVATVVAVPFDDHRDDDPVEDDGSWSMLWAWLSTAGRPLLALMGVAAAVNFVLAFFNVSMVALATEVAGVSQAGLVIGAGGAAMIVGAIVSSQRGIAPDRLGTLLRGLLAMSAGLLLCSLRPVLAVLLVGVMLALFAVPMVNASTTTLYNEQVPATMQGRVFAVRGGVGQAVQTVGALLAGVTMSAIGPSLDDGLLADTVGEIIGIGAERAGAVVLAGCSVVLVVITGWLRWSATGRALRSFAHRPATACVEVPTPRTTSSAPAEGDEQLGDGSRAGEQV